MLLLVHQFLLSPWCRRLLSPPNLSRLSRPCLPNHLSPPLSPPRPFRRVPRAPSLCRLDVSAAPSRQLHRGRTALLAPRHHLSAPKLKVKLSPSLQALPCVMPLRTRCQLVPLSDVFSSATSLPTSSARTSGLSMTCGAHILPELVPPRRSSSLWPRLNLCA